MRPLLTYNGEASGGSKLYYTSAFGITQLDGNVSETNDTTLTNDASFQLQYKSVQHEDGIYVIANNAVMKYDINTQTFSTFFSLSGHSASTQFTHHLFLMNVSGTYYLIAVYGNTSGTISATIYNFTTKASNTITSSGIGSNTYIVTDAVKYNNSLYLIIHGGTATFNSFSSFAIINPVSLSFFSTQLNAEFGILNANPSLTSPGHVRLCIFDNELFMTHALRQSGSTPLTLYRIVGTSAISAFSFGNTDTGGASLWELFTDGTSLYFLHQSFGTSWILRKLDKSGGSFTSTTISSTVIPQFTTTGNSGFAGFMAFYDLHENPENPQIILAYTNNRSTTGAPWNFYRWNGPDEAISFIGSAGNSYKAIATEFPIDGGGELAYSDGEMHTQFEGDSEISTTPGNTKLRFRVFESFLFPSGSPVVARIYAGAGRSIPSVPCRLANPSDGTIEDDYVLTGITSGSGNLYEVDWRTAADGFGAGAGATLIVAVSGVI